MKKFKIRKGDNVRVVAGAQKGSEGKVVKIISETGRVIVEGINLVRNTLSQVLKVLKEVLSKKNHQLIFQTFQSLPLTEI